MTNFLTGSVAVPECKRIQIPRIHSKSIQSFRQTISKCMSYTGIIKWCWLDKIYIHAKLNSAVTAGYGWFCQFMLWMICSIIHNQFSSMFIGTFTYIDSFAAAHRSLFGWCWKIIPAYVPPIPQGFHEELATSISHSIWEALFQSHLTTESIIV